MSHWDTNLLVGRSSYKRRESSLVIFDKLNFLHFTEDYPKCGADDNEQLLKAARRFTEEFFDDEVRMRGEDFWHGGQKMSIKVFVSYDYIKII